MKENPGTDVSMVFGSMEKFHTMLTAGMMPNTPGPWDTPGIHADANRNWALELTPYLARDGRAMDIAFFLGVMRGFRVDGQQHSLPTSSYVDYYVQSTAIWYPEGGEAFALPRHGAHR